MSQSGLTSLPTVTRILPICCGNTIFVGSSSLPVHDWSGSAEFPTKNDVAVNVLESLFRGVSESRFPELTNRDNLWRLLFTMAVRKTRRVVPHETAEKRGGGLVRSDSLFHQPGASHANSLDQLTINALTLDVLAMIATRPNGT